MVHRKKGGLMAKMHCPICNEVSNVSGDMQVQCPHCRNWAHIDNWTYTDKEWARMFPEEKKP